MQPNDHARNGRSGGYFANGQNCTARDAGVFIGVAVAAVETNGEEKREAEGGQPGQNRAARARRRTSRPATKPSTRIAIHGMTGYSERNAPMRTGS